MKLTVSRKSLLNSLGLSTRFTTLKAQLPILGNVLLEGKNNKLNVSATNLEMSVSDSIAAKIEEEGRITVPSKAFYEVVSNLTSENVDLNSEKEQLTIKCAGFSSRVMGIDATDFPLVPMSVGSASIKIKGGVLASSLPSVIYAISSDETRPTLTGVLITFSDKLLTLVATDGYRLSKYLIPSGFKVSDFKFILPKGILSELARVNKEDEVQLEYKKEDKQVVFQIGSTFLSSRVIEGEFPNYEKIIPSKEMLKLNVDRGDLLQSVKLASVFARDASNVIKFMVSEKTLRFLSESSQLGSQENTIDAKIEANDSGVFGDSGEFIIAFNCKYVEDFLNSCDGDSIEIKFNDPNSPGVFTDPKEVNLLHLIMPVRLQ